MRRFWLLAGVGVWILFLLAGCTADEWQTIRAENEAGYLVALPSGAEAEAAESAAIATAGGQLSLARTDYRQGDAVYTLAHASLADEVESAQGLDDLLDDLQRWLVEESGYQLSHLETSTLSWQGYPGRAYRFQAGTAEADRQGRAQVLLVEENVYLLLVAGPQEIVDERGDRFLASFDLTRD